MGDPPGFSPGNPGVLDVIIIIGIMIIVLNIITIGTTLVSSSLNHMVVTLCAFPVTSTRLSPLHIPILEAWKDDRLLDSLKGPGFLSNPGTVPKNASMAGEPLRSLRAGESGQAGDQEGSACNPTRLRPRARKLRTAGLRPAPMWKQLDSALTLPVSSQLQSTSSHRDSGCLKIITV